MKNENCELCNGTGWYGDNGPGIIGNREYVPCENCNPKADGDYAVLGDGWRDANRDCPDDDSPVLVCSKLRDGLFYEVGFWVSGRGWAIQGFDSDVIAWKPIDPPAFA